MNKESNSDRELYLAALKAVEKEQQKEVEESRKMYCKDTKNE